MPRHGVLLVNLGTPESATIGGLRKYLWQFLTDKRVVDLPYLVRQLFVYFVILPFRPQRSLTAYKAIWRDLGSPLLIHSEQQKQALQAKLGDDFVIALGMRYGKPPIKSAVEELLAHNLEQVTVIPLFPQYSSAASGSAIEEAFNCLKDRHVIPHTNIISDFFVNNLFIQAQTLVIQKTLASFTPEKIIFSFHGLPLRHIQKIEHHICNINDACPAINSDNRYCYKAQCFATARAIAKELGLKEQDYIVTFQSRLGKTPWIGPYTDVVLDALATNGIKKVLVACPSFVSDCLETLEEMHIRAKARFENQSQGQLLVVPCVNDHTIFIEALCAMVKHYTA